VINPKQPTISTQVNHEEDVTPGTTLTDSALLGNTATPSNGVQGTITFRAFGPEADATTCTAPAVYTSVITVSGNGTYSSANGNGGVFAPTTPGHYNWTASYAPASGDVNNLPVVSGCGDAHEGSVVIQLQPTIGTAQTMTLSDSATISVATSGAGNLAGSVRFRLYNNASCDPANNGLIYDSNVLHPNGIAVSGSGTFPQSATVNSDTTTFTTSKPTLSWLVEYTSTNGGHKNVTSACNVEHSSLSITNQ
jgi:hypothetical protein